jgi:DNA-binding XRE family transcriptional regulator
MNLNQYRKYSGITFRHLAKRCDIDRSTMSLIVTGKQKPSFDLALTIERITGGHVKRDNWYPSAPADVTVNIGASSL